MKETTLVEKFSINALACTLATTVTVSRSIFLNIHRILAPDRARENANATAGRAD